MNRNELIITVLQQRIGEITSSYELQIAALRAEITAILEERDAKKQAEEEYADHLSNITN